MLTLILIALVAGYAWFFYTDRMNTLKATKYMAKATGKTIKTTAQTIKLEADIVKLENEVADLTIESKDREVARDAIKDVDELFTSIGIDKEFRVSRANRLKELKSQIADLKA
jgi:hypothetical protein